MEARLVRITWMASTEAPSPALARTRLSSPDCCSCRCSVAPGSDTDTQALLDLAQVAVELAAEHGQMTGVIGFQGQALLRRRLGSRTGRRGFVIQIDVWPGRAVLMD